MNDSLLNNAFGLSPYDPDFPLKLLEESLNIKIKNAENTASNMCENIVQGIKKNRMNQFVPFLNFGKRKYRLVVDAPESVIEDIHRGVIKLTHENNQYFAQLNDHGKYSKKLPVKEEQFLDGMNPAELQNALQLQAIQQSIAELQDQIEIIDQNVKEVCIGQRNDRLGLYYGGIALFIEANGMLDPVLKNQQICLSLQSLTNAIFQLNQTLQSDILYLVNEEYAKHYWHQNTLLNEKMNQINESFMAIHQATLVKAGIYCHLNETNAMITTLREYERFIEDSIVKNADMLVQCDANDDGTEDGIWKRRAALQLNVSAIIEQLQCSKEAVYVQIEDGEAENEND